MDASVIEWRGTLQPRNYEALPLYTPDPNLGLESEEGLILIGTDGGVLTCLEIADYVTLALASAGRKVLVAVLHAFAWGRSDE